MSDLAAADSTTWDARLVTLALRQVLVSYRETNAALFSGRLATPQLRFSEACHSWGAWRGGARILELSLRLLERPWGDLLEVLKHEMAHQYVDEVLGAREGEGPHGPTFVRVCLERGIDPKTAGDPSWSGQEDEQPPGAAVLKRVQHLLSLAQSENQHEAESAMRAAQRLMLKYNIESAVQDAQAGYVHRHLGQPTGRRMAWQRVLGNILSEHFFVEVIIVPVYRAREAKRGSVLEACGSRANLEIAGYVHDFLERSALSLWERRRSVLKEGGRRSDAAERNSYLYGVMRGFADKLEAERGRSESEGLIYLGDPELREFLRRRHHLAQRP